MTSVAERPLTRGDPVAVIDDVREDAEITASLVSEAGFDAIIVQPRPSIEDLLNHIRSTARAAICDQRLSGRAKVDYYGAEFVALSNENNVPAVLITTYADVEAYSIRRWRSKIPCLLRRGRASDPDAIFEALIQADKETAGRYEASRVPYRSVVRVHDVREFGSTKVAEVVVSAWNPSEVVEVPVSLITQDLPDYEDRLIGSRFMAYVNIYAETPDELYFRNFEPAPELPDGWPS